MIRITLILLIICAAPVFSGATAPNLEELEAELALLRDQTAKAQNDAQRKALNEEFRTLMFEALYRKESFDHPFSKLPYTAILTSADKRVRIINWNVPSDNDSQTYYAFVQFRDKKRGVYKVKELTDKSAQLYNIEYKVLEHDNWYGALYYDIIVLKGGGRPIYTLLGWDENDRFTTKKIIEAISFDGKGTPKFGATVFKETGKTKRRVIFEYTSEARMSLKYNPRRKAIIFDHLSAADPELQGLAQFQGPDLSFDAFHLKNGRWIFERDVDITGRKANRKHRTPPPSPNPVNREQQESPGRD